MQLNQLILEGKASRCLGQGDTWPQAELPFE